MSIGVSEVKAGDLLLFHGDSFVSWAIRRIDGSEVNHVAIALGDGRMAEAGGGGLVDSPVPTAFNDDNYAFVRSHLAPDPRDAVLRVANDYLTTRNFYAYQQIVLLAVLGLTRRIPARGLARRMIRSALDHAARSLQDLLPVGRSWMICSEFAYRCFDEAVDTEPDPWKVAISGLSFASEAAGLDSWIDWAQDRPDGARLGPFGPAELSFASPASAEEVMAAQERDAEAELAPLIAEWARFAGEDPDDPLPPGPAGVSFGEAVATIDPDDPAVRADAAEEQRDLVSDDELREAMVRFATSLAVARSATPGIGLSFGIVPGSVTATVVSAALQGLVDLTVDPNFVTPADLYRSPSFTAAERLR